MALQDRLKDFLKHKGLTYRKFEQICEFGNGTAKRFDESIKKRTLNSIIANFPDLNPEWLISGEGEMLRSNPTTAPNNNDPLVPLYSLDAVGGFGSLQTARPEYVEKLIPWPGPAKPTDIAIPIVGNSMAPIVPAGSLVLLHPIPDWRDFIALPALYVIILNDDRRLLKELHRNPDPDLFTLHSYNPDVPDQDLPKRLIRHLFLVTSHFTPHTL